MRRPNTFIVGAPKCGTTALSTYLSEHREVFLSDPKEPNYFCSDLPERQVLSHMKDYLTLFEGALDGHSVVMEASTWYLVSRVAVAKIMEFEPRARLIVMVRNPIDLVHSLHWQQVYSLEEPVTEFRAAWTERRNRASQSVQFQYGRIGLLGKQLLRLREACPEHQVLVVRFEDFVTDTSQQYRRVLAFLSLPDDQRQEFPVVNPSKHWRSRKLAQYVQQSGAVRDTMLDVTKRLLGVERVGLSSWLNSLNTKTARREPLSPVFREELYDYFKEDIELLESLIDEDLSSWRPS